MVNEKYTGLAKMNFNDPNKIDKYQIINGINRFGDLINSINRDMESRILLIFSIIISSIIGFLLSEKSYLIAINLGLILLIFLIWSLIKESKDKKKLNGLLSIAYKNAIDNGINLR